MDTDASKLDTYFEKLRATETKVPCHGGARRPNFVRISAASGVSRKFLVAPEGRRRITLAVEELGLDSKHGSTQARHKSHAEQNAALVCAYLQRLEARGLKLPENPVRRGEVYMAQVEVEVGLAPCTIKARRARKDGDPNLELAEMIRNAVPHLGMEARILTRPVGPEDTLFTYELLFERGTKERELELEDKPNARSQLYNTRSALTRFCKALNLNFGAEVGSEFTIAFRKSVDEVLRGIKAASSQRKFQTEIGRWHDYYRRLVNESSLPVDFHEAFAKLIDMSGLTFEVVGKLIGVQSSTLVPWYRGRATPSREFLPAISQMELLCKLPSGSLVNKIKRHHQLGWIRPSKLPAPFRGNRGVAERVCPHLPADFLELPPERQKEIFESVRDEVLKPGDAFNKRLAELQRLPYTLKAWPAAVEQEFEQMAYFKTAERPPLGMERKEKWKPATAQMARQDFDAFFGALCLPVDAQDVRVRGLGMTEEHLTLALIACPLVVDWFIRFRHEIRTQYTNYAEVLLQRFMSLMRAETGWLRQRPELGLRLHPLRHGEIVLISQELVDRARDDWDGVCQKAIEYYWKLNRELEPLMTRSRDPFRPIEGILSMENPMEAFEILLQGMRDELPNIRTQPVLYHTTIRNCALVALIATTGFRRKTVSQLDYTGGESGHLIVQDGFVVLNVPRGLFKHPDSPFFGPKGKQSDYNDRLPNFFWLVDIFSEYLTSSRPFILDRYHPDCEDHPLFVMTGGGKHARMSPDSVSEIYCRVAGRHLVGNRWRGTGIQNVWPSGPHSARHIRGTAVIKKTGSFLLAGYANHNTERMAYEHYARLTTQDRNSRARTALFGEEGEASTVLTARGSW
jgi:transcriptional regulator with XRE-family HTH domain